MKKSLIITVFFLLFLTACGSKDISKHAVFESILLKTYQTIDSKGNIINDLDVHFEISNDDISVFSMQRYVFEDIEMVYAAHVCDIQNENRTHSHQCHVVLFFQATIESDLLNMLEGQVYLVQVISVFANLVDEKIQYHKAFYQEPTVITVDYGSYAQSNDVVTSLNKAKNLVLDDYRNMQKTHNQLAGRSFFDDFEFKEYHFKDIKDYLADI